MSAPVLNGLASMSSLLQSAPDARASHDPSTPIKQHISYSCVTTLPLRVAIKRLDLNKGANAGLCRFPYQKQPLLQHFCDISKCGSYDQQHCVMLPYCTSESSESAISSTDV